MKKSLLLLISCLIAFTGFAITTYPSAINAPYGGVSQTVCQNSQNIATTVTYSVCATTVGGSPLSATATWILNGVTVYTTTVTIAATTSNITLPAGVFIYSTAGTFSGTNGLYCKLSWIGASPCGAATSDTGAQTTIIVNPVPLAIGGTTNICLNSATTLTSSGGDTWASGNTAIATVGSSTGIVTGDAAGTANITYKLSSTGCLTTTIVTINPLPVITASSSPSPACSGANITLTASGGVNYIWAPATGLSSTTGSSVIAVLSTTSTYTIIGTDVHGCVNNATDIVSINPIPPEPIVVSPVIYCQNDSSIPLSATGSSITWYTVPIGGTGFSIAPTPPTVTPGTTTYYVSQTISGCESPRNSIIVTINPIPHNFTGKTVLCTGSTVNLFNTTLGGSWSSSNTAIATVSSTGVVTGISLGAAYVSYILPTGCYVDTIISVHNDSLHLGTTLYCDPDSIAYIFDPTTGLLWTTLLLNLGDGAYFSSFTYANGHACEVDYSVILNPLPDSITGITSVCVGLITPLSDDIIGGSWSSSNTSVAIIGSTGLATGITEGTTIITYTLPTGCLITTVLTVNPLPSNILGFPSVCVGLTTTLSDNSIGGSWISSNTTFAIVSGAGEVTGILAGTVNITYILPTGCITIIPLTVNPLPANITGVASVCAGLTTSLSDITSGGTWSSSNTAVATIGSTGFLSGLTAGTANITYTLPTGCVQTIILTVNPQPNAGVIAGVFSVCVGSMVTLTDVSPGGIWTSINTSVAIIGGSTGHLTGVTPGVDSIEYTVTNSCGTAIAYKIVTVNPLPTGILGIRSMCSGLTTTLSDATAGGTWSSSATGIANIGSAMGIVTGGGVVITSTATITYTLPTGCIITAVVTVNPLPSAISGALTVCFGLTTALTDATAGGTWTSSNGNAAIGSITGIVTGITVGTSIITYTLPTGCIITSVVTINSLPVAISGILTVCAGLTTALTDGGGGIWSSSVTGIASIGSTTGIVTGGAVLTTSTATITYTIGTSCIVTAVVTINPSPTVILGTLSVCAGLTTTLSDAAAGGTWSSSATGIASIGSATGLVTGGGVVTTSIASITYTLPTGCFITALVTVNPLPTAILGTLTVCTGLTSTLSDAAGGGTWSSSATGLASVGSTTGVVTGGGILTTSTATITYTTGTGCVITTIVTVNPLPTAILGTRSMCSGLTTALSDAITGGTWSSSATGIASIGSATGIVTGGGVVTTSTVTITYTLPTGCIITAVVTVNPLPSAISGTLTVCFGLTTAITDATAGGTWTSSNGNATIGSVTGIVTGVTIGTSIITYTLPTGCIITSVVTVNSLPVAISGTLTVCAGLTTALTDGGGGTWSSSATGIASIGSATGIVTGGGVATTSTATITYTLATGCIITAVVTVNPLPSAISGALTVCFGLTTALTDATAGGTWTSSNGNAAIGSITGIVTGVTVGTSIITYTLPTGCIITSVVTINSLPVAISGILTVCAGLTTALTDGGGGTWSSSVTGIASIGSTTGVVTGGAVLTTSTATITYTIGTSCIVTAVVTVNPSPTVILGTLSVCAGLTTTLSDAAAGGTWSSSATGIASIGSATGLVTGGVVVTTSTASITYTLPTGCFITAVVTVNPLPTAILGTLTVCSGLTTTLTDAAGGGTWISSATGIASVGSTTGIVTGGVVAITSIATITYTLGTGCVITTIVTVNPLPTVILGTRSMCSGLTTILSDATTGGTWSSSATGIASIGSATGIVTGGGVVTTSTVTITYTLPTGCIITAVVTVNPLPSAISGTLTVCFGLTTALTDATAGGTWTSSNGNATIGSVTGIVTGVTIGTSIITYTLPTGCIIASVVTVNSLPVAISGTLTVCSGLTTALTDAGGGTWSSSTTGIASVGSTTGIVTGGAVLTTSTATITYTIGTGCIVTVVVTVNPSPTVILGTLSACAGLTTTLSDAAAGGTWSSSATGIASIGSATGLVTGGSVIAPSTATITYTIPTGCYITAIMTINPLPTAILGTLTVCAGLTTTLSDAASGGTWSSSATGIASTGSTTGVVTGGGIVTTSTATITYITGTGCIVTTVVTVNPSPTAILGTVSLCAGLTTTLSDATTGGTWTSSATGIASIGSATGLVTGGGVIAPSTATITYTIPTGCYITAIMTVNPLPTAILGTLTVCAGLTSTLSDAAGGGTWSSSATGLASVGSTTGVVTGGGILTTSTATITYTTGTGCVITTIVTVNPLPTAILGTRSMCSGLTTALSDAITGGTWSSSATGIASIGSATGIVTGGGVVTTSTATITYTLPTGCIITAVVTVNPLPSAISGTLTVCFGLTTALTDATAGGTWTSSNGNATIGSVTGIVTGVTIGTSIITYTLSTGCIITSVVTVNSLPVAISGTLTVCAGLTTTLTDGGGGTWSSSATGIASIGSATGIVTGGAVLTTSTATITYTIGTGCIVTVVVTVNPSPTVILGTLSACAGLTTTLSDAAAGGTWSSSATGIASIGSATGLVTGGGVIAPSTATITYTLPTSCVITAVVTVNPLPTAILGTLTVCSGLTTTMADMSGGGIWSSSATGIASVGAIIGMVTGGVVTTTSTATITYTAGTGCITKAILTVNPLPTAILGTLSVCAGLTTALSDATTGGTWSSSNTAVATIASSGIVAGLLGGTTNITYTLPTGCIKTILMTVNPIPLDITGVASVCAGLTTVLSDITSGGTWSSSNTAVATIGSTGIVSGFTAGTTNITYTLPTGCMQMITFTVNPLPETLYGATSACIGSFVYLTDSAGDIVYELDALFPGITTLTFSTISGCSTNIEITVNPLPAHISGVLLVCVGGNASLTDSLGGGTWSSSNTAIATIASSGMVSGLLAGTSIITYTLPTGCYRTTTVTVNNLFTISSLSTTNPSTCSGIDGSITIFGLDTGILYHVNYFKNGIPDTIVKVSNGLGEIILDSLSAGLYTNICVSLGGCTSNIMNTVLANPPLPTSILGALNICYGLASTLSDTTVGGTWTSSNNTIATIGSSTGIVTGLIVGTSIITYKLISTGCITTSVVTVNSQPIAITGNLYVCQGMATSLSDLTLGGIWNINPISVASITSGGLVTGFSPGTAFVSYTIGSCYVTSIVTVNPLTNAGIILGLSSVCASNIITLSDLISSGIWSSSNSAIATIDSTGKVIALSSGAATISYQVTGICGTATVTHVITVNPLPNAGIITGSTNVCLGTTISLSDTVIGGAWSSSNPGFATIGSSGILLGIASGITTTSYTYTNICGSATAIKVITVNPLPFSGIITGTNSVCVSSSVFLSDSVNGGIWASSNSAIASIGSSGIVTGVVSGTATISYVFTNICGTSIAAYVITVNPLPNAGIISGLSAVCAESDVTLSNAISGGIWSSSNTSRATIGTTGIISGLSGGTTTISYAYSNICGTAIATQIVTVIPLPSSATISGSTVCVSTNTTFSNSVGGGTWTSGDTLIATIGIFNGIVTGISPGTNTIIYSVSNICGTAVATQEITVNPLPYAGTITGPSTVCAYSYIDLSDTVSGGLWSSSDTAVATVDYAGTVTGVNGGTTTISYTYTNICSAIVTKVITVLPITPIFGNTIVCVGSATSLSDGVSGGTWSDDFPLTVASINESTGAISSIGSGTTRVIYSLSNGCKTDIIVTVNPIPPNFYTMGGGAYCIGGSGVDITLSGSDTGIVYKLYQATSFIDSLLGTGYSLNYGLLTTSGIYTVQATNIHTGCTSAMDSPAVVSIHSPVVPLVSLTSSIGTTPCVDETVFFTATPTNGGITPVYRWYVNSSFVASGSSNSYSYTPLNGDSVSVVLNSDAICAIPDTAIAKLIMSTITRLIPSVTINVTPSDSLCPGTPVMLTPSSTNGGIFPVYSWYRNGISEGSSLTYTFMPNDGDNLFCELHSTLDCATPTTVNSNNINMIVPPIYVPLVTVTAHPSNRIAAGEIDTFVASVVFAGLSYTMQWEINNVAVPGAQTDTFISSTLGNRDTVSCMVTGESICGSATRYGSVVIIDTNIHSAGIQQLSSGLTNIMLIPNPNNGTFKIIGSLLDGNDEAFTLEITDMLGSSIYKNVFQTKNGKINEQIQLGNNVANGMYLLIIRTDYENKVFHIVVEQ